MPVSFFLAARKGCQESGRPAGWLVTVMMLDEDQWYFLSVSESYGVVVSLVFLFKTSRVRTPETSEDYSKLSSGDVFKAGEGVGGGGRYEGPPLPCSKPLQKQGKVSYGVLRSFEDTLAPSKVAFNILTQSSHYPISQMHYCSMIPYFKSFQRQVKRASMFAWIIVNGSFKIPPQSWSSLCSYLNATDNALKLFEPLCLPVKSDRPWEVR